jgi:hypothetical protein
VTFRIERWDASWGGWRLVPDSWMTERPFESGSVMEAGMRAREVSRATTQLVRVVDERGQPVVGKTFQRGRQLGSGE